MELFSGLVCRRTYKLHCIVSNSLLASSYAVRPRPLEERIRELCEKAIDADTEDFNAVLTELQAALSEHTERMRTMALEKLAPKKRKD